MAEPWPGGPRGARGGAAEAPSPAPKALGQRGLSLGRKLSLGSGSAHEADGKGEGHAH